MKNMRRLTSLGGAAVVLFSFTTTAFAEETPVPTPSPTESPVAPLVINPTYSLVTIDDRQLTYILFPLYIIMMISIAAFIIRASAPLSLRRSRR